MIYNFKTQLRSGQIYERELDSFFSRWFEIRTATKGQQRQGIDRIFINRESQHITTVEYKADKTASRTGNAFVETISVDTANKPGWAYTSKADWLFYYLPEDRLIYFFHFSRFRHFLPKWTKIYQPKAISNKGYCTHGILVPLRMFERYADKVLSI